MLSNAPFSQSALLVTVTALGALNTPELELKIKTTKSTISVTRKKDQTDIFQVIFIDFSIKSTPLKIIFRKRYFLPKLFLFFNSYLSKNSAIDLALVFFNSNTASFLDFFL